MKKSPQRHIRKGLGGVTARRTKVVYEPTKEVKDKFLFVHTPKTAGSTFAEMLRNNYRIYTDIDFRTMMYTNPKVWSKIKVDEKEYKQYNVVKGHFPYQRFHYLKKKHGWNMVAWVRDPIERLISHYSVFFYGGKKVHPQVERVIKNMDIVEFSKFLSNFSTRFLGRDPSIFDFIGVVEKFDESIEVFNDQFNCNLQPIEKHKVSKQKKENPSAEVREIMKQHYLKDYEFYEKIIKRYIWRK